MNVTYEDVRKSEEIRTYIKQADESLKAIGYTEHSFAHCTKVAKVAGDLLEKLGYDAHEVELARIAGFMHDIGNVVNRIDHAQSGAMMAFRILDKMGMPPEDVATVITAIGNHDEQTAAAVNAVAAALIIADKTDVRRSRVRNRSTINFDIHDRVNYAAEKSDVILEPDSKTITLDLKINTEICAVMDYFEIFTGRMLLCRKAAEFLGLQFKLDIRDDTVVSVVLQGSSAQLQSGTKLLVRHEALTVKHGAVVHHGTFKIVNHSVEVVHDVVHPLAVSCHYFIAHSCLVLLLILTLPGLLAALD